jgi:hypothetical protein
MDIEDLVHELGHGGTVESAARYPPGWGTKDEVRKKAIEPDLTTPATGGVGGSASDRAISFDVMEPSARGWHAPRRHLRSLQTGDSEFLVADFTATPRSYRRRWSCRFGHHLWRFRVWWRRRPVVDA